MREVIVCTSAGGAVDAIVHCAAPLVGADTAQHLYRLALFLILPGNRKAEEKKDRRKVSKRAHTTFGRAARSTQHAARSAQRTVASAITGQRTKFVLLIRTETERIEERSMSQNILNIAPAY